MSIERAFCRNKEHLPAFRAFGLPDKLIYVDGRGAEDLERFMPPAPYAPMDKDTSGAYVAGLLLGFLLGFAVAGALFASGIFH